MTTADVNSSGRSSTLGPVVFVGLALYALATHTPGEIIYANPAETMNIADIQSVKEAEARDILAETGAPPPPLQAHMVQRQSPSDLETAATRLTTIELATEPPGQIRLGVLQLNLLQSPIPQTGPARAAAESGIARQARPQSPGASPNDRPPNTTHLKYNNLPNVGVVATQSWPPLAFAALGDLGLSKILAPDLRKNGINHLPRPGLRDVPTTLTGAPNWASVTGNAVHLRNGPDRAAQSLAKFYRGRRVLVIDAANDWSLVNLPDAQPPLTGWMSTQYLQPVANAPLEE